ncbi:MAG: hypothetical protein V9E96_05855 [Chitinophagaceae bacterium]
MYHLHQAKGTRFRLYYNFKANYTYLIYATVAADVNTVGNNTRSITFELNINNTGGGGNTTCNGAQDVNPRCDR